MENARFVDEHQSKFHAGQVDFQVEINKFADWRVEERVGRVMEKSNVESSDAHVTSRDELPAAFDWRKHGAVGPVMNQANLTNF